MSPYIFSALMVTASAVLIVRGQLLLGVLLMLSALVQGFGWEYIIRSDEAPGFTENLSVQYRIVSGALDVSVIGHYVIVLVVIWRFVPLKLNK